MMIAISVVVFAVLGLGACFLGGIIAIVKGCEVLNERIAKGN